MLSTTTKKHYLKWWAWFFIGNTLFFWLIGLNYLSTIPWLNTNYLTATGKKLLSLFLITSYAGHLALLALLVATITLPLLFFKRKLFLISSVLLASTAATWLLFDTFVYTFYRFHLNGIVLNFAIHGLKGSVFDFSRLEIGMSILMICAVFTLEIGFGCWLWRRVKKPFLQGFLKWIIIPLPLSLYFSYAMIFYSAHAEINRLFLDSIRFLPLHNEMLGLLLPTKEGRKILERSGENHTIQSDKSNAPLNYPRHPLVFKENKNPLNLVIIAIDTWRFDMLNTEVTPLIEKFSKKAWVFNQHISGGNSTGPGFFSFFYGIPATYWTSMEKQHRAPILLDTLLDQDYQMGIFSSAKLTTPPLHKTVFQHIPNLDFNEQAGDTWREKDRAVTIQFKKFIQAAHKKTTPFFSFIVYKSAHAYCFEKESIGPFQPVINECNRLHLNENNFSLYINRYKNALFQIDQEIAEVIQTLEQNNLLKNTVIILTGDHGEEFDDNHLGFWGHGSNFTRYQTQVPLIIYWPEEKPRTLTHLTSHFDIVPTLMTRLLGNISPMSDYSIGKDILDTKPRPYLILNSYIHLGILEPQQITTIYPSGHGEMTDLNGQKNSDLTLNTPVIAKVLQTLRQF